MSNPTQQKPSSSSFPQDFPKLIKRAEYQHISFLEVSVFLTTSKKEVLA